MSEKKYIVALTGGIGSGKSYAGAYLRGLGTTVIDTDILSREVVRVGSCGLQRLKATFGAEYLMPNGELDRKKLAELVFSDCQALKKLNEIMHPLIEEELFRQIEQSADRIVFVEIPLLIGCGFESRFDCIWTVSASEAACLRRALARDGGTQEGIWNRIKNQVNNREREKIAHTILRNEGTKEEFEASLFAAYQNLVKSLDNGKC